MGIPDNLSFCHDCNVFSMLKEKLPGERYQRMGLQAEVIILKRGASWDVHGIDISATGMFVSKPDQWPDVVDGDFGLEVVLDEGTISLAGRVARKDGQGIAFEFTRIPPDSEAPLWSLLGEYADATELLPTASRR